MQAGGDRAVAGERLRAAAQDHRVAGLQAQRGGIGGHVRARLVDHRDHAERDAHALDQQPVGARLAARDLADRIGQRGDLAQCGDDARHALGIEREAIQHRAGDAGQARPREIVGIRGEDRRPDRPQIASAIASISRCRCAESSDAIDLPRVARGFGERANVAGSCRRAHATPSLGSTTRSSRWITASP